MISGSTPRSAPRGRSSARRPRLRGPAVAVDQRRRIRAGAAGAVSRHGFAHATVTQIVAAAGVSRRTFYELYPDMQAAFLAAHEEALANLTARVSAATASLSWRPGVEAAIGAALAFAATFPERALLLAGGPLTAGPWAAAAHDQLLARFAPALARGRCCRRATRPAALEEVVIAGISGVVAGRLRDGRAGELPALAPQLTGFALAPYLEPACGRDGAGRPPPAGRRGENRLPSPLTHI